jgi:hypothetical protein
MRLCVGRALGAETAHLDMNANVAQRVGTVKLKDRTSIINSKAAYGGGYNAFCASHANDPVVAASVDKFILGNQNTGLEKMTKDGGITSVPVVPPVA